jgi:hypothetical protein
MNLKLSIYIYLLCKLREMKSVKLLSVIMTMCFCITYTNADLLASYPDGTVMETRMTQEASKYETCKSGAYIVLQNTDNFDRYTNITFLLRSDSGNSAPRLWNVIRNVKVNAGSFYFQRLANYTFFDVPSNPPAGAYFSFDAVGNFTNTDDLGYLASVPSCVT